MSVLLTKHECHYDVIYTAAELTQLVTMETAIPAMTPANTDILPVSIAFNEV